MNRELIVLQVKQNLFGEFNEAGKPKTSLAKYSVEFNHFAVPQRPHQRTVFEAVRQSYTLHITVCKKGLRAD